MDRKVTEFLRVIIKPETSSQLLNTNNKITHKRLFAESFLVSLAFSLLSTGLLFFFPFDSIDLEELTYGDFPIALIDNQVTFNNLSQFQTMSREGSMILLGLPVTLLFWLFGPTLWTLKFAGVLLSGFWAATWYCVARLTYPSLSAIYSGILFAIPLPLIQLSALTITSIMTHLGASTWHGVSLLLICLSFKEKIVKYNLLLFLSGLFCGLGIYCGYALIPLVPGILWLAWKLGGKKFIFPWLAGLAPTIVLILSFVDIRFLSDLPHEETSSFYFLSLVKKIFLYGAGFIQVSSGDYDRQMLSIETYGEGVTFYSQLSVVYSLIITILVMVYIYRRGFKGVTNRKDRSTLILQSIGISFIGYFAALYLPEYKLDLYEFDGLRYLVPLFPMVTLLILGLVIPLENRYRRISIISIVMLNILGYFIIAYPFSIADHLGEIKGYSVLGTRHIQRESQLNNFYFSEVRQYQRAFWFGVESVANKNNSVSWKDYAHSLKDKGYLEEAENEYWRGVGFALIQYGGCSRDMSCALDQAPKKVKHLNWQGASMWLPCEGYLENFLKQIPSEFHDDIYWGLGRGLKWYRECYEYQPEFIKTHPKFMRGREEGWVLEFSPHGSTDFYKNQKYKGLYLYAFYFF